MSESDIFAAVEARAFNARVTMTEVCKRAEGAPPLSSWSRAKAAGSIGVALLRKIEDALTEIESERAAA